MLKSSGTTVNDTRLMMRIREIAPTLNKALRLNAEFILKNPLRAAVLNIEQISVETKTSTAAVNRLSNLLFDAQYLDNKGFTGLRQALVENLLECVSPADKVTAELIHSPESGFSLEQQVRLSKGNLDALINNNDEAQFGAFIDLLTRCNRLFMMGFNNSRHLAAMAVDLLLPHCTDVQTINQDAHCEQTNYRLARLDRRDVILAIDLPPYHGHIPSLTEKARQQGATVLGISDSPASPLVGIAQHCLFTPTLHPMLPNSGVGVMSVIEGLSAALRMRNQAPCNETDAGAPAENVNSRAQATPPQKKVKR